jgi:hypothetical protein
MARSGRIREAGKGGTCARRPLRAACVGVLLVALATPGWTSVRPDVARAAGQGSAPVSLLAEPGACKPGVLEALLNDWLVAATRAEFESEYVAIAFDELVSMVAVLRDVAQDFCV